MPHFPLNIDDLIGCREIRFINRQESNYPTLMRLVMDFDCCVLQLQQRTYSHISLRLVPTAPTFIVASKDYTATAINALTPTCASLQKLESYALVHQVDILHDYLFGDTPRSDSN